jgi:hypothetical protein
MLRLTVRATCLHWDTSTVASVGSRDWWSQIYPRSLAGQTSLRSTDLSSAGVAKTTALFIGRLGTGTETMRIDSSTAIKE